MGLPAPPFATLKIPIVRGRGFTEEDRDAGAFAVVLSETLPALHAVSRRRSVDRQEDFEGTSGRVDDGGRRGARCYELGGDARELAGVLRIAEAVDRLHLSQRGATVGLALSGDSGADFGGPAAGDGIVTRDLEVAGRNTAG